MATTLIYIIGMANLNAIYGILYWLYDWIEYLNNGIRYFDSKKNLTLFYFLFVLIIEMNIYYVLLSQLCMVLI